MRQELAKGKSAAEAYVLAGYKANDGNCIRLKGNERVLSRVKELVERTAANAAARAEVTAESLLNELEEARKLAAEINQPSAAVAATLGKAKVAGLIVERKEVGRPGDFEGMKPDELRDYIAREAAALGIGMSDVEEEGEGGAAGSKLH